jgi:gentisate 1,2-dioxygenase
MLRPGETLTMTRRSASAVVHVIEGAGVGVIDDVTIDWSEADTFAIPTHATVELRNQSDVAPAFLFLIDDAPLQRRLCIYEEFTT